MKHFILLISICLAMTVALTSATVGYAEATFQETAHDFGVIKEAKGPVSHTFKFTNTGTTPLVIVQATASCGCTRPEYPTKPIKPGKSGNVKVTFNPAGRPGAFKKLVKIKTNGREHRSTLVITGTVTPGKK